MTFRQFTLGEGFAEQAHLLVKKRLLTPSDVAVLKNIQTIEGKARAFEVLMIILDAQTSPPGTDEPRW